MARNPDYDVLFDCNDYDLAGNFGRGILSFLPELSGEWLSISTVVESLDFSASIEGTFTAGTVWDGGALWLDGSIEGEFIIGPQITNLIKWSKIGQLDFTIDRTNEAGQASMEWQGAVVAILKLGSSIIVYGTGGITQLIPKDTVMGMKTLSLIGIPCDTAAIDVGDTHFFINNRGQLCSLAPDKLQVLGYEEFLASVTSPLMVYDKENNFIYICNGVYGYVYGIENGSLGTGPINITGISSIVGNRLVLGSGEIVNLEMVVETDAFDLGSRIDKTLKEIEIGAKTRIPLSITVYSNRTLEEKYIKSPVIPVNPEGVVTLPIYGKDFKIKIRAARHGEVKLEYIRVKGVFHDFKLTDAN